MADSRPLPGPCTRTWTRLTPRFSASRAAPSAATVAANGVLFLEPLKPAFPDDPHATVLPCRSVIVTVVLLKVAAMCATPSDSMTRLVFFPVAMLFYKEIRVGFEQRILRLCLRMTSSDYFVIFFFPAIARRGPFFVRAFVCVR